MIVVKRALQIAAAAATLAVAEFFPLAAQQDAAGIAFEVASVRAHCSASPTIRPDPDQLHFQEGAGASSRSRERLFEFNLGGEAVTIAPDRQSRQLCGPLGR